MTTRIFISIALAGAFAGAALDQAPAAAAAGGAPLAHKHVLSLAGAKRVAAAALAEARRLSAPGAAIAVTDDAGTLLYLERLDGTFAMAATVSAGKARTAALFQKPTRVFEEAINKGRTAMTALPDFTPLQGGVPIVVDGQVAGAIGVSGAASAQQDDEIAVAAAKAALALGKECCTGVEPAAVTHIGSAEVAAAFAAGRPLLEVAEYKIHASRREQPGQAEVHSDETDVIYVLSGKATFVTGGALVDAKETAPHELRGSSIQGGQSRSLEPGDVVVVPAGTPHWFQQVEAPFTYYVVKVVHHGAGA
jgi:glc operon protein GlcG